MKILTCLTSASFLAAPAFAQQTVDTLYGANAGDRFGAAVAFVGDINHDGNEDFAVGTPGDDTGGVDAGSVTVFSGADRSVILVAHGLFAGGRLGESVDGVGDVDLDGFDDIIAGAPGASQALVISGQTGGVIHNLAPSSGLEFGTAVAGIGLANADGFPDFAVGAIGGTGLWVFSGVDGQVLWTNSAAVRDLGGLGDVNGDGYEDLVIGDHTFLNGGWGMGEGRVIVFSGLTGAVIRQHVGSPPFDPQLGKGASGLGDIDGDGVGDYGYGVPCICFASHYAEVRSGATGALIHTLVKYTIGHDLAPAGDLDLDGTPDILVTEPGALFAFRGSDGGDLFQYGNLVVVDGGADATGDGYPDIVGGAHLDSTSGTNAGRVDLLTLGCPYSAPENYCTAAVNSTGAPAVIDWMNSTSISTNNFRLFGTQCPPNQTALFFYGPGEAYSPLGDGFRCVAGPLFRLGAVPTGPTGLPSKTVDFTSLLQGAGAISPGETWRFQLWFRDPQAGLTGSNLSNGLRVTFCL